MRAEVVAETTEPTAQLQDAHARLELELAPDQVQLLLLGLLEASCEAPHRAVAALPVRARVLHVATQHLLVEVIAQIIVHLRDFPTPKYRLRIQ